MHCPKCGDFAVKSAKADNLYFCSTPDCEQFKIEKKDWAIVISSVGNYHLMPAENVWANDTVMKELEDMTEEEAEKEYKQYQQDITPKFC